MLRNDLYQPWFVEDKWGIEIISGDYIGTVIQIEKIEFKSDTDGELLLDFNVINRPETLSEEDLKSEQFNYTFELIMHDIIKEALESYEQTRTDDSPKSSS